MSDNRVYTITGDNNISRASTASIQKREVNTAPMNDKILNPYYVGVQSKFRRRNMTKLMFMALIAIIIGLLIGITILASTASNKLNKICHSVECIRAASNFLTTMNLSANPCHDFYEFTCGRWDEEHSRLDSSPSSDWFSERQSHVTRRIRDFLQENSTNSDPGAVKKTRILYSSCTNTNVLNTLGLEPLFKYLKEFHLPVLPSILNITLKQESQKDKTIRTFDWVKSIAEIKRSTGGDLFIGFDVIPDPRERQKKSIVFGTPETESMLPFINKDHKRTRTALKKYLGSVDETDQDNDIDESNESGDVGTSKEEKPSVFLEAYIVYVTELMSTIIFSQDQSLDMEKVVQDVQEAAMIVLNMTTRVQKMIKKAENMTNKLSPEDDYRDVTVTELQRLNDERIAPKKTDIYAKYLNLIFKDLPIAGLVNNSTMILTAVGDIHYLQELTEYLNEIPLNYIELYLWWSVVEELALHTSEDIRRLHKTYTREVTKIDSSETRSSYCANLVNTFMGMAVSYGIMDSNFLNETKPKVTTMIENIKETFRNLVLKTNWMDSYTKKQTMEKVNAMKSFIGFPDWLFNQTKLDGFYDGIEFKMDTYLVNLINLIRWDENEKYSRYNESQEYGWATSPTKVNAFHTFQANTITIPLAILQYPFYQLGLEVLNYGAIGTILGHEITHGFDDSGRRFDKDGNLRQWWTNQTINEYVNRTKCFINQYSDFKVPEISAKIDGEITLGENIADNGGFKEAYYAYKRYVEQNGPEKYLPGMDQFTHEQLFFISFGNLWCEKLTPVGLKWALEDSHCPGRYRMTGVLSNSPEFTKAFQCKENDQMNPKNRCELW